MRGFLRDVRYSIRTILKNPGFTLVVVLTLALAMGPNTLIFSLLDAIMINEGPYKDAGRLLILNQEDEKTRVTQAVSYPNFEDWRKMSQSFSEMAAYRSDQVLFRVGDSVRRVHAESVSLDFFRVMGIEPILGRTFTTDDFRLDAPRAVVLKYGEWQKEFGGRPDIVGTEVVVDRVPGIVVGVMPSNFRSLFYGRGARLWLPLIGKGEQENRAQGLVEVVGRPKPGIGKDDAARELKVVAARLASAYPDSNRGIGIRTRTIREVWLAGIGPGPRIIGPLVLSILLVACGNVANLLLARAVVRRKEIALRQALGAGRFRLIRQLLVESSLMGLAGSAVGLLFANWGLELVNSYMSLDSLGIDHLGIDRRTLQFTAIMGIGAGIVFGLLPALKVSKISLSHALKEGGPIAGRVKNRLAGVLVVSELSIALIMLAVVSMFIASATYSINISYQPGFRISDILTADFSISEQAYETPAKKTRFYKELLSRTAEVPGIVATGLVSGVPGGYSPDRAKVAVGLTDSKLPLDKAPGIWVNYRVMSSGYLKALGIPLLRGRSFTDFDNADAPRVALVSQRAVAAVWKGTNPIGQTLSVNGVPHTVVGIVADVRTAIRSTNRDEAEVLVPYLQEPRGVMSLVAQTKGNPEALIPEVRARSLSVGQNDAAARFRTMEDYLFAATRGERLLIGLVGSFGLLAALIAAAGVYGIMSHFVSQKVPEIGVRMALGAGSGQVLRQVMREGSTLILIGVGIGCPISLLLIRFLPKVMFGVVHAGPLQVGIVALSLTAVAVLACYLPARRASRVDPLVALRYE
ncbi:MAG: ABC transporter permease [Acidobacteria bacterium]|nr:MAG: ABC transporter permease [Acidobacteriota bacterium]